MVEAEGHRRSVEGRLLRHLDSLLALARARHFGDAAAALGVSQPAFSQSIRALETLLGVSVVRRTRRFEGFTPEGEVALDFARRIAAMVGELRGSLTELREVGEGELRIGVAPDALFTVPLLSQALRLRAPERRVRLEEGSGEELLRRLRDGQLAAAVAYPPLVEAAGLVSQPLHDDSYVLIASPSLGLAGPGPLDWAAAARLPLGLPSAGTPFRRAIDELFAAAGVQPRPAIESDSLLGLLAHAAVGACAILAPALFAATMPPPPGLLALRLAEPKIRRPICLLFAADRGDAQAGATLRDAAALVPHLAAAALAGVAAR